MFSVCRTRTLPNSERRSISVFRASISDAKYVGVLCKSSANNVVRTSPASPIPGSIYLEKVTATVPTSTSQTHTHTHTLEWSRCVTRRALRRRVTARVAMTEASRGLRLPVRESTRRHVADRAAEKAVQLGWTSFAVVQGRSAQRVLARLGLGAARNVCAIHVPARADHAARERRVRPQPVVGRLLLWRLLLWVEQSRARRAARTARAGRCPLGS